LKLGAGGLRDIGPDVQELADSLKPIQAARGRRLLELVEHLRLSGPVPRAFGDVILDELWIMPLDDGPSVSVKIQADWYDYGPDHRDLSKMHFRISSRKGTRSPGTEVRAADPIEAERVILDAFGRRR